MATAVSYMQDCFTRYNKLRQEALKVNVFASSDLWEFGDTLDSLLHAGLVAHAQGEWQTAVNFFTFFENNKRNYVAIRPLCDKVEAAKADMRDRLGADGYETAVAQAQEQTLEGLLSIWLV